MISVTLIDSKGKKSVKDFFDGLTATFCDNRVDITNKKNEYLATIPLDKIFFIEYIGEKK